MVNLLKVHGSQNHFFILDQTELDNSLTDKELRAFTKKITNPKTGILNGADGVLVMAVKLQCAVMVLEPLLAI